ncbi:hypothetical protein NQ314_002653, partial [Rhamnusium bicolor]
FPFKRPEILKLCVQAIRWENWFPSKMSRLCGEHFLPSDNQDKPFCNAKFLKPVPSIFSFPKHLAQKAVFPRRKLLRDIADNQNKDEAMQVDTAESELNLPSASASLQKDQESQTPVDNKLFMLKRTIKTLRQKVRRKDLRISTMKDVIKEISKSGHSTENLDAVLENYFRDLPLELVLLQKKDAELKHPTQRRYSSLMKKFAHTLYFYSPKAYHFLRQHFVLPEGRTIRRWLSSVNCNPGILEVLEFLKEKAKQDKHLKNCVLIFDSMAIRKQVLWDAAEGRFIGNVNYGGIVDVNFEAVASEALFFQITNANLQPQLINTCISRLYENSITIRSITSDGAQTNITTYNKLGCTLTGEEIVPYFRHPCNSNLKGPLELYFSCIRSRGGWNNNPNCQQLKWSPRQLLFRNSVTPSVSANCGNFSNFCTPTFEFRSEARQKQDACKIQEEKEIDVFISCLDMKPKVKGKFHQYDEDSLKKAVEAVRNGGKLRVICRQYGIPKSTVQDRIEGKVSDDCKHMGPDPVLTRENEQKLVTWIENLAACGFPIKKDELLNTVQKIVQKEKLKTPFTNGRLGGSWFYSFMKRHSHLALKNAEALEKYRAQITEEYIRSWFGDLKSFFNQIECCNYFRRPKSYFERRRITEKLILKLKPELSELGFCTNTILTLVKSLIPKMSDGSGVLFFTPEEIDEMEVVFADDTSTTESDALSKVSDQNSGVVIIQDILLNPKADNLRQEAFARKEDDDKFQEIEKINVTEEKIKTGEVEQIEKSIIYEERLQTENTLQGVESEKPNLKQERVRTTKEIIKPIVDGDNLDEKKIVQEKQVAEESTSLEKEKIIIDGSETQPVTEKTNFKKEQPERDHRLSKRTDKGITKPTINDKHLEEEKIIQEQTMTEFASLRNEKNNSPNPIGRVQTESVIEQPLNKNTKKRQREKIPSAISSNAWRKYYEDKLKEKEEKENAKKKNADNLDQEAEGSSMRDNETEVEIDDQKNQNQSIFKQKCGECEEELESDAEIETEKNTVQNGEKLREVCRRYGVPKSTVLDRIKGRVTTSRMGPNPILTDENEQLLVNWISALSKCGFPLKKQELLSAVEKNRQRRQHKNSVQKWSSRPDMVCWIFEKTPRNSNETFLKEPNALSILQDPSRILNGDESGFSLCPKTGKVLGLKGHNSYSVKQDGRIGPPVVVFPYIRPPKALVESMPADWILGKSETGWMWSDKPVLFLVDGHRSHMSIELSRFCDKNGIILYALPPNATHLLQPADVSIFKPMKEYWRQYVREWQIEYNRVVTKTEFCPIFKMVLNHPKMKQNIKNGFKACGLYPFNSNAIDYSKCVQNTLETINSTSNEVNNNSDNITQNKINSAEKALSALSSDLSERKIDADLILTMIKRMKNIDVLTEDAVISEYEIREDGVLESINKENINVLSICVRTENLQQDALGEAILQLTEDNTDMLNNHNKLELAFKKHLTFPKPLEKKAAKKGKSIPEFVPLTTINMEAEKQKCGVCEEPLDSDAELEDEKDVGCDLCPRWFHLGCTKFVGSKYDDVANEDFVCDLCM